MSSQGGISHLHELLAPLPLQQGLVVPDSTQGEVPEEAAGQPDPENKEKNDPPTDVPEGPHLVASRPPGNGNTPLVTPTPPSRLKIEAECGGCLQIRRGVCGDCVERNWKTNPGRSHRKAQVSASSVVFLPPGNGVRGGRKGYSRQSRGSPGMDLRTTWRVFSGPEFRWTLTGTPYLPNQ
jgi:hypothetical protein